VPIYSLQGYTKEKTKLIHKYASDGSIPSDECEDDSKFTEISNKIINSKANIKQTKNSTPKKLIKSGDKPKAQKRTAKEAEIDYKETKIKEPIRKKIKKREQFYWFKTDSNSCRYDTFLLFYYSKILEIEKDKKRLATSNFSHFNDDEVSKKKRENAIEERDEYLDLLQQQTNLNLVKQKKESDFIDCLWAIRNAKEHDQNKHGHTGNINNLFNVFYSDPTYNLVGLFTRISKYNNKCFCLPEVSKSLFGDPIININYHDIETFLNIFPDEEAIRLDDLLKSMISQLTSTQGYCSECKYHINKNSKNQVSQYNLEFINWPEYFFICLEFFESPNSIAIRGKKTKFKLIEYCSLEFEINCERNKHKLDERDAEISTFYQLEASINYDIMGGAGHYSLDIANLTKDDQTLKEWYSYNGLVKKGEIKKITKEDTLFEKILSSEIDLNKGKSPNKYPFILCYKKNKSLCI
jgi:hypothetical protein